MAKLRDDSTSFGGGQNSSVRPYALPDGFYYRGINLTTINDKSSIRPKFIHQEIKVVNDGSLDKTTYSDNFLYGKYQGDCPFTYDGVDYWIVVVSGIVYQVDLERGESFVLNEDDRLNQYTNRLNCTNFGKYVQIFDFPDRPLIIERGGQIFRTNTIDFGTPAATNGVFNYNRGFVVNSTNEWLASDPVGGESADAPLSYVESANPQSEFFGAFNLGFKNRNSDVTYIGSLPTNDTGIGSLILSTDSGIYSYGVNQPRANWAGSVFGGEVVGDVGIAGPRAAINYKRDLIFLSSEGYLTTIKFARSNEQSGLTAKTLSGRSQDLLDTRFKDLYVYGVLEAFDQRLFTTAKPYRTIAKDTHGNDVEDFAHAAIHVMEFQTKDGEETDRPADAGIWTGVYPMTLRRVGGSMYIFSKDPFNNNRVYKLDANATLDKLKNKSKQVVYRLYTKGYTFGSIDSMKDLHSHVYEVSVSGDWKQEYHLLKSEHATPIPLTCKTDISVPDCDEDSGALESLYLDNYSAGVEFSDKASCNKFFRSIQLIITGTAKVFDLFRISVHANKTNDDNLITDYEDRGSIPVDCEFTSDLNVYSLAEREDYIK